MGYGPVADCQKLMSANIQSKVKVLPYDMFNGCAGLKNVTLNDNIEEIYKDFNVLVNEEVVMTVTNPKTSTSYIKAIPSEEDESVFDYYLLYDNKKFKLPYHKPLKTHCNPALNDHNLVKGFLLENGWDPSEWRVRDLTRDSKKKTNKFIVKRRK